MLLARVKATDNQIIQRYDMNDLNSGLNVVIKNLQGMRADLRELDMPKIGVTAREISAALRQCKFSPSEFAQIADALGDAMHQAHFHIEDYEMSMALFDRGGEITQAAQELNGVAQEFEATGV